MNWKTGLVFGGMVLALGLSSCGPGPKATSPEAANAEALDDRQAPAFSLNVDEQDRALRGYDPVAYFADGQAVRGDERYSLTWQGSQWLFASAEHRDRFAQTPERYAPANGGYCTFGVVLSKKFDSDPTVWSILDGTLYLFLNTEVREQFLQDRSSNLARVAENWPQIRDKAPTSL